MVNGSSGHTETAVFNIYVVFGGALSFSKKSTFYKVIKAVWNMIGDVIGTDIVDLSFRILDTNQNSRSALWLGRGNPRNILITHVREYSFEPSNQLLASFKSTVSNRTDTSVLC